MNGLESQLNIGGGPGVSLAEAMGLIVPTAHVNLAAGGANGGQPQTLVVPAGTRRIFVELDPPTATLSLPQSPSEVHITSAAGTSPFPEGSVAYRVTTVTGSGESVIFPSEPEQAQWLRAGEVPTVTWVASPSAGVTGYNIYRRGGELPDRLLTTVGPTVTSFTDNGSLTPGAPLSLLQPLYVIDGIELEGGDPPEGYDLCLERWYPPEIWIPEGQAGFPHWEVPPGVPVGEWEKWANEVAWINVMFWPYSKARSGAQIRSEPGGTSEYQCVERGEPLCTRLIREGSFWRRGTRSAA